jgi:Spy/CpxP family protein refolding chaperone
MKRITLAGALLGFAISPTAADAPAQPYSGMQTRTVRALSDEQIRDLRAGRGMGFALAAELNGYPGPTHVLDSADELDLSAEQRTRVETLFAAMKAEAMPIGEKIIGEESALDRQFADRTITPVSLANLTSEIGRSQGELRAVHLKYHLATVEILTPHQLVRYKELRGYGTTGDHGKHGSGAH